MAESILLRVGRSLASGITPQRSLTGFSLRFVQVSGAIFAAFFIYGAVNGAIVFFGPQGLTPFQLQFPSLPFYNDHYVLPLYILCTAGLIFLLFPARMGKSPMDRPTIVDWAWCLVSLGIFVDYVIGFEYRASMTGAAPRWNDILFGGLVTLIALECCRRVLGWILPVISFLFILYDWDLIGPHMPGDLLLHKGYAFSEVLTMAYGAEGIYGVVTRVYANLVFLFLIFGAFLQFTKVGDILTDLAFAVVGWSKGGPAKAAVFSSCLVGSVCGSGVANIAITGTFTIPMMKKAGYKPEYAGAVETVASIGGHIMPPVMGSGAFLIAGFTETPYSYIALVSFMPGILYYLSCFMGVHFRAGKRGLRGLRREELPNFWTILKRDFLLLLPILILVVLILVQFSAYFAAFWSLVSAVVCYAIKRKQWFVLAHGAAVLVTSMILPGWLFVFLAAAVASCLFNPEARDFLKEIALTFALGSTTSLIVAATAGVMGIILGGMTHSGLGLKLPQVILSYAYGYLWAALLLCAFVSYLLGMGMTVVAAYVLLIIVAGPALQELGLSMLAAHLIVYWMCQYAALSPPFALGAFVAAGIAKGDPIMTGFHSFKLGQPIYLVPIMFAYCPAILMVAGTTWVDWIVTWVSGGAGLICSAAALEGYMLRRLNVWERLVLLVATVLFMWYSPIETPALYWTKVAGLAILGGSLYLQHLRPMEIVEAESPQSQTA